jgi:hypothetical protein
MKKTIARPNSQETVYEVPFTAENAKTLFEKRMNDNVNFLVKDARMVRQVTDQTGIVSKTFELFANKAFDYLYNSDYISPQQKAESRQRAIDEGLLPPAAQEGQKTIAPPKGTYG